MKLKASYFLICLLTLFSIDNCRINDREARTLGKWHFLYAPSTFFSDIFVIGVSQSSTEIADFVH